MGDINATIGKGRVDRHLGEYGRNNRGNKLFEFCEQYEMKAANCHQRGYRPGDPHNIQTKIQFEISLISFLSTKGFKEPSQVKKTYPRADINLDHNSVVAKIYKKLKNQK